MFTITYNRINPPVLDEMIALLANPSLLVNHEDYVLTFTQSGAMKLKITVKRPKRTFFMYYKMKAIEGGFII